MTKLLHEMPRREAKYSLVTVCFGEGKGITTIIENPRKLNMYFLRLVTWRESFLVHM